MKAPKRVYIVVIENDCGVRCTVVVKVHLMKFIKM